MSTVASSSRMPVAPPANMDGQSSVRAVRDVEPALRNGAVIGGKYVIMRVIGRGGMGEVYEARHIALDQGVAIKALLPEFTHDLVVRARFEREARAAAKLSSDHAARVVDVATSAEGVPCIIMELLEGQDLEREILDRGRLPVEEAVGWALQACSAITEAHGLGIIHRDIKPSNLFLAERDGRRILKVLDFGISKELRSRPLNLTTLEVSLGTPCYMSPEQIRDPACVDERTDIWSLGVILYELLSGAPPFVGVSSGSVIASVIADEPVALTERCPAVPEELSDLIARTLSKNPRRRVASVAELASLLEPFAAVGSAWSLPPNRPAVFSSEARVSGNSTTLFATPPAKSSRRLMVGGLAGILLLAGVVARFVVTTKQAEVPSLSADKTVVRAALPSSPAIVARVETPERELAQVNTLAASQDARGLSKLPSAEGSSRQVSEPSKVRVSPSAELRAPATAVRVNNSATPRFPQHL